MVLCLICSRIFTLLVIIVSINDSLTFDAQQQPFHVTIKVVIFLVWYLVRIYLCCSNHSSEVQDVILCAMENNTNIDSMLNDAWTLDAIAINTSPPAMQEISLREIHALHSQVKAKCCTRQWQTVMQLTIDPTIFGNKVWLFLFVMHHIVQKMYWQQSTKVFKVMA